MPVSVPILRVPPFDATAARRAPRLLASVALLALLALDPAAAHAEKADREKPINYSADSGDVNYQTKIGTLTGSVIVTQGTLTIHADKIILRQNPDNSLSATAYGNPVTFRQKRDGVDEYFDGFAQHAEYDGSREFLELFDRALLRRGQDEIRSNYISYNAATELFKAEGRAGSASVPADTGPGSRVRGVFQPKSESLPGKDATRNPAKDAAKDGAKALPKAPAAGAPLSLTPAGELAPSPAK
jgi:lipopolysaccharide export system protein LptA